MSALAPHGPRARTSKPWRDDPVAIGATMAGALRGRYSGWDSVTAGDVGVEDHSGFGGGKAYKLTNRVNPAAPAAALHILHESFCPDPGDPIVFDRQRIAHALFAEAGLSRPRICQDPGKEWFVEEWGGADATREEVSVDLVEEVARLVARAHAIDPAWYDDIRARKRRRYPELGSAPDASHIWWFASYPQHFLDPITPALYRAWSEAGPRPVTKVGSRLVTVHGDAHRANVVRGQGGLQLIDMEAVCVTRAVHDVAYCFGTLCDSDELKEAFTRAYLMACGLPAFPEDVFALRLDTERCKMATNWFDVNGLWGTVYARRECTDLGPIYPRLVAIADRALVDRALADEIVKLGFENCAAVREVQRDTGKPLIGMPVTAHTVTPDPIERSRLVVHWDGSVEATWEPWRGAVLGIDERGQVVLTNSKNTRERLRLRVDGGRVPITGRRAPDSAPVHLTLTGPHAGQALVLGAVTQHVGNDLESVTLGPAADALAVHFEPDGMIRLADRPHQAFDCERARTTTGTRVHVYHSQPEPHQRFVTNDEGTLSPIENRDVIWGIQRDGLMLVGRQDRFAERLTFCDEVAVAASRTGPGTWVEGEPPACPDGCVLELASHRGLALAIGPYEDRDDVKCLTLVPIEEAPRFIVAGDHLRLVDGGARIALGTPLLPST